MVMDREASSWALQRIQEMLAMLESEYIRPSVLLKPQLRKSGPLWRAEYDELWSLGSTPDEALRNFDRKFREVS